MSTLYDQDIKNFYRKLDTGRDFFQELLNLISHWAQWPKENEEDYLKLGLFAEAGEIADVHAKFARGDFGEEERDRRLAKEFADVLFFLFANMDMHGFTLGGIAETLVEKLNKRFVDNTIKGDGSDR